MSDSKYSQWYPYQNVQDSYTDNTQLVYLPRMICDYLIDAPKGDYTPPDDNSFARCRFWKNLYYDGAKPEENVLPTIQQKMSVVFNADKPETPPTDKGYRLIPQVWVKQSQTEAQTRVFVYLGREIPQDDFKIAVGVHFLIWGHYTQELNTRAVCYDRLANIEQAILQAFNGVYMTGMGTFQFNKRVHADCQSRIVYDDKENIGRELVLACVLQTTATNTNDDFNTLQNATTDGKIRYV